MEKKDVVRILEILLRQGNLSVERHQCRSWVATTRTYVQGAGYMRAVKVVEFSYTGVP